MERVGADRRPHPGLIVLSVLWTAISLHGCANGKKTAVHHTHCEREDYLLLGFRLYFEFVKF